MRRSFFLLAAVTPVVLAACASLTDDSGGGQKVSFDSDIRPILEERCVLCHNSETLPGRLNFESAAGAFVNDSGGQPYILPGKPEQSRLYTDIIAPEFYDLAMPPVGHRVTDKEARKIWQWIEQGAEWPKGEAGRIAATDKATE